MYSESVKPVVVLLEGTMTVLGIDDTDSRQKGMCTTYVGAEVATRIREKGYSVSGLFLFRLNPAAKHKTRGNACVAIKTEMPADKAVSEAKKVVDERAVVEDDRTHPGIVAADSVPPELQSYTKRAVRELIEIETAVKLIESYDLESEHFGVGRGRIGALAAISVPGILSEEDSTYEYISYRELDKCGTERDVNIDSVFEAANNGYPGVWDTVDRADGKPVCVPNAPGPILHGIRGDNKETVKQVAESIDSESVSKRQLFVTNQGTDMHLQPVENLSQLENNSAFQATGNVVSTPEFKEGGHLHFSISDSTDTVKCIAFEPTHRFRTEVLQHLKIGDKVTVCGEVSQSNIKLEKLRVDRLRQRTIENPTCTDCNVKMNSQGRGQGYSCKHCNDTKPHKVVQPIEREIKKGWYEVPPCARRHIAKPLIRGGFAGQTHPFR